MGCSPGDLPESMNDREKWPKRVRCIRATSTTWWWWWYEILIIKKLHFLSIMYAKNYICLSIIWKSDLTDKMKRSFFQAAVVSILLYGCTTWTLTKRLERRLDGNYTRMLRAVLNKSWRQHPTRLQLYGHLPPITKTIQVRRTRHAGSLNEFIHWGHTSIYLNINEFIHYTSIYLNIKLTFLLQFYSLPTYLKLSGISFFL